MYLRPFPRGFTVRESKTTEQMVAYWNRVYSQMCNNFQYLDPFIIQSKTTNKPEWEE